MGRGPRGIGLGAVAWFAGEPPARLVIIAAASVAAGIIVTAVATPLRRLPHAELLAQE